MKSIFTIAKLNAILWIRTPLAIISALVPTVGMVLMLILLSLSVREQPVAMVVESEGKNATRMADIIRSDDDAYCLIEANLEEGYALLNRQEVAAIIVIPADFEGRLACCDDARVKLILNNVDIDFADDIRRAIDMSVAQFDAPRLGMNAVAEERANVKTEVEEINNADLSGEVSKSDYNPYLVNIHQDNLRETDVDFLSYQVIPGFILLILSVGFVGPASIGAAERNKKTGQYFSFYPVQVWQIITGKMLGGIITTSLILIPALFIAGISRVLSATPDHWLVLIALFMATMIFASSLGVIIGSMFKNLHTIALVCTILSTYLFFLGGGFTTIAFLPEWLQTVSAFNPIRYAIDGMRQSLFYSDLTGVGLDIFVLLITAFFSLGITTLLELSRLSNRNIMKFAILS